MSRQRQALGQLTNQTNNHANKLLNQNITKQVITTTHKENVVSAGTSINGANTFICQSASSSSTTTTTSTFKTVQLTNDENELQQQQFNKKSQLKAAPSFDFDIFQDTNKENETIQQQQMPIDFQIFCDSTNDASMKSKKQPLQQISLDSPMVLDDTIRFESRCSSGENESIEIDDEIDEAKQKKLEAEQRECHLLNCEEYATDILKHLKELEQVNRPKPNYIKQQQDITSSMRSILVDWLVEVCEEYKLHTETLFLAVNYTDRFLSKMSVLRGKLQLLGTASMYIASKYEEIFPPDINDFVYITDDTYTKQQVLRMEHLILKVLNFHMNAPTANCFLLYFLRYLNVDSKVEHLARYIAELTLVEAEPFLEFLPSQIATCALYLSLLTLGKVDKYTEKLEKLTGYKLADIKPCLVEVHKCMLNARDHAQQAIQDKYKQERYDYVSLIEPLTYLNC